MAGPTGVNARTSDGIFPSLGSIQSASYLRAGSVVKNYQDKLDYFISETDEGSNIPISGTAPQLYANPEVTTPGTGETNTASNIGVGEGPFAQKVASDLQFNSEKYDYGIESQLLDNTYYRGLNPFVADGVGAFSGDMITTRSTPTSVTNKSGVIETVLADRPAYGVDGLSCFGGFSNYLIESDNVSNPAWIKTNCEITNDGTLKPDNSSLASKFTDDAVNGEHFLQQSITHPSGDSNRSIYVKDGDGALSIRIRVADGAGFVGSAFFNLQTLQFYSVSAGLLVNFEPVSSGWIRIDVGAEAQATGVVLVSFYLVPAGSANTLYSGAGNYIYICNPQFSNEKFAPPYSGTGPSSSVVATESSYIQLLGNAPIPGGSLCFIVDCDMSNADSFGSTVSSSSNDIQLGIDNLNSNYALIKTTDGDFYAGLGDAVTDGTVRFAYKYHQGELKLFKNGTLIETKAVTGTPTYSLSDLFYFGSSPSLSFSLNSYMKIKKWFTNEVPTDAQILEMGGPDNVIL